MSIKMKKFSINALSIRTLIKFSEDYVRFYEGLRSSVRLELLSGG